MTARILIAFVFVTAVATKGTLGLHKTLFLRIKNVIPSFIYYSQGRNNRGVILCYGVWREAFLGIQPTSNTNKIAYKNCVQSQINLFTFIKRELKKQPKNSAGESGLTSPQLVPMKRKTNYSVKLALEATVRNQHHSYSFFNLICASNFKSQWYLCRLDSRSEYWYEC